MRVYLRKLGQIHINKVRIGRNYLVLLVLRIGKTRFIHYEMK